MSEAFHAASAFALQHGLISFGDVVVVTAGSPFGQKGTTNMMLLENIEEVVVRGCNGLGHKVQGQVAILLSPEGCDPDALRNRLVVIAHCDHTFLHALQFAAGIIVQNFIGDLESEAYAATLAKSFGISMICRADGAMAVLREGETMTLDPQRGLLYRKTEELSSSRVIGPGF